MRSLDGLVQFCVAMLRSHSYINNPHLRAKTVELLYSLAYDYGPRKQFSDCLFGNIAARSDLVPAVLEFYVAAESTGRHSQFYEKFKIRYEVSYILKVFWQRPEFRERIKEQSRYHSISICDFNSSRCFIVINVSITCA